MKNLIKTLALIAIGVAIERVSKIEGPSEDILKKQRNILNEPTMKNPY